MTKEERIHLLRALAAASNAFHDTLRERGYEVSYGLNDPHSGSIHKLGRHPCDTWPLGDLEIRWKLRKVPKT